MLQVKRFTASWCGPCISLAPIMNQLQSVNPTVQFQTIDIDENSSLTTQYEVRSIPLVVFEKDGTIVDKVLGLKSQSTYQSKIDEWK